MQYTEDSILRSDLVISQPAGGYRFAIDAVLLADFIRCGPEDSVLEIGAGSGVVMILMAAKNEYRSATAVEIQEELAELCRRNFERNHLPNARVVHEDIRNAGHLLADKTFDLIYSNPPYRKLGAGRLNPSMQKAIARHEIKMKLEDLFEFADRFLKPDGRLTIILPEFRERDFHQLAESFRFHPREWKYVHSFADQPPAFFLASIGKIASPLQEHPPLMIYETPGEYTAEMSRILGSPF